MVRLKVSSETVTVKKSEFQFLMVRLKGIEVSDGLVYHFLISIPYGSIKS